MNKTIHGVRSNRLLRSRFFSAVMAVPLAVTANLLAAGIPASFVHHLVAASWILPATLYFRANIRFHERPDRVDPAVELLEEIRRAHPEL